MTNSAKGYEKLLRKLHQLIVDGKSDSDEATKIREDMDPPWFRMTDKERCEMRNLAEQLYKEAGR